MYVTKASGDKELFDEAKLLTSIQRAGIAKEIEQKVFEHVKEELYDNIPTSEIYRHVMEFLSTSPVPYAASRYNLKKAIMELGPTGYPFEDFITRLLSCKGYKTSVRNIVKGTCITHEIDIIAEKDNERIMIEAKFHNTPGMKTNVHVAMYTKARFDDTKDFNGFTKAFIVTNTKVSEDALVYARCRDISVIGWNYPKLGNLRDLIEECGFMPITSLTSLSNAHKQALFKEGVVICKDIVTKPDALEAVGVSSKEKNKILDEASFACELRR